MTAIELEHASDIEAIKALIQAFFDSINAADAKALQSHFFPSAGLTIIRQDPPREPSSPIITTSNVVKNSSSNNNSNGAATSSSEEEKLTVVIRTNIENFVKLIEDGQRRRPPGGPALFEAPDLDATEVKVDALFAMAWSPFTVTFDGVLHHYGTMVYTVGKKGAEGWKIEGLTQNYRRTPGWDGPGPAGMMS